MRNLNLLPVTAAALLLGGCSTQMAYDTTQTWQRQECRKMPEQQQRERCLSSNATSYEDYRRQVEAAKSQ